jgi:tetratricopeptide (TPR) repeat protein
VKRLSTALRVVSTLTSLVGTAIAVATTDWSATAVCGGAVLASLMGGPVVPGVLLAIAVLTQAWVAAAAMGLSVVAYALAFAAGRVSNPRGYREDPLRAAVAELTRLPPLGPGPVTTVDLVRAAIRDDPVRWSILTPEATGQGGEEELAGTGWTRQAAEAVILARHLPGAGDGPGIHELALAAIVHPGGASQSAFAAGKDLKTISRTACGVLPAQLVVATTRAVRSPGGELIFHNNPRGKRESAQPTIPAPTPSPRPVQPRRKPAEPRPRRAADTADSPPNSLRGAFAWLVRGWPVSAKLLWRGVRPAGTLLALAACLFAAPHSAVTAAGVGLAVLVVRPVRGWWASTILAAACVPLVPVAAIGVALRLAATEAALRILGPRRKDALARLIAERCTALGVPPLDEARSAFRKQLGEGDLVDLLEELVVLAGAAWAEADIRALVRTAWREGYTLLVSARAEGDQARLSSTVVKMLVLETIVSRGMQAISAAAGVTAALVLVRLPAREIVGIDAAPVLAAAAATLIAAQLARPSRASPSGVALTVAAGGVALGVPGLWTAGYGLIAGLLGKAVINRLLRPRLAQHRPTPVPPWWRRWNTENRLLVAAGRAKDDGRLEVARQIWLRHSSPVALALLAELAQEQGDLQQAVDLAEKARAADPTSRLIRITAAKVYLAAGDVAAASTALDGLAEPSRRDSSTRILLARVHALSGNMAKAQRALSGIRVRLRWDALGELVEGMTATAPVIARTDPSAAAASLRMVIEWTDIDELVQYGTSADELKRIALLTARARVVLGQQELALGDREAAEITLRLAVNNLAGSAEPADLPIAQMLLGCATAREGAEAVGRIEDGLRTLEEMRGQLRRARQRGGLAAQLDDVYTETLRVLSDLSTRVPAAGAVGAVLLESLRRDALATVLRDESRELPEDVRSLLAGLDALEEQEADPELIRLRRVELGERLSEVYAAAYLPSAVSLPALRDATAGAHVLLYRVYAAEPSAVRGHVVWIPPGGAPAITGFDIGDPDVLDAIGVRGIERQSLYLAAALHLDSAESAVWTALGEALLPQGLVAALDAPLHLVVAADGLLTALPWAGLPLRNGRRLVETATIQLTSAISLLDSARPARPSEPRILFHQDADTPEDTGPRLARLATVRPARTRAEIQDFFGHERLHGAYFSVHGDHVGLDQGIVLGDGSEISAATALALRWPNWVIFASCIVGRLDLRPGHEPTGLATSCLFGGASTVIAGVVETFLWTADRVCVNVADRLLAEKHPAAALREAQLEYLQGRGMTAPLERWACYVCISREGPHGR